jgi:Adenylate and Guanylate cyclase catalytic domain
MACGGLTFIEKELSNKYNKNYVQRVVDLAQDMMKFVHTTTFAYGIKLNLKIGVHFGPCIYGVIGYHKPQFSLIGDTVNTTSRHCTTGDNGVIVLSQAAKDQISTEGIPNFKTASVHMKGKGLVEVFMILPQKKSQFNLEQYREHSGSAYEGPTFRNLQLPTTSRPRRATVVLSKPIDRSASKLGQEVISDRLSSVVAL